MAMHKWIWTTRASILVLMLAGSGSVVLAQSGALPTSAVVSAAADPPGTDSVRLLVGRSAVLDVGTTITRVSLTSADVADALVTSPTQLLINGKMPGTISMFVWDRGGALRRYEVIVQRDLARLSEQMRDLFPGENIQVQSNGKHVVLSGTVSSKDVIEKAVNVAAGYVDKKEEVTALLQLQAGAPSNQVLLRVRFAEVSRSALTELGSSFFTSPLGVKNTIGRVTTEQFAAPGFQDLQYTKQGTPDSPWQDFGHDVATAEGKFTFSDFLNLFFFNEKYDLGMMIKALSTKGLFQSLAEPNLVAESGKEASFLAGGEFPIPVAQGSGANIGVSVMFKEFGIRLTFTPTVNGNRVHLKVRPEVSALDFNNAVVLGGFRIPALTTRRTETELELENGQTFVIAGLLNNTMRESLNKIPGIGDIPILGLLFKSKAAQKEQTELVVMITPQILPNNSRGVTPNLPRLQEPFLAPVPDNRTMEAPPPAFGANQPGAGETQTVSAPSAAPASAAQAPAAAAASVSALTSSAPRVVEPASSRPELAEPSRPELQLGRPEQPATAPSGQPAAASTAAATRPLSPQEQRTVDRARQEEAKTAQERARAEAQAYARAQAAEGKRITEERAKQERFARKQAARDAEAAKKAQEAAKKQAERDRRQQKAIEEAAARLKAAEAAYNAQVARQNNP
jgi:pilus assembly protein CpaC